MTVPNWSKMEKLLDRLQPDVQPRQERGPEVIRAPSGPQHCCPRCRYKWTAAPTNAHQLAELVVDELQRGGLELNGRKTDALAILNETMRADGRVSVESVARALHLSRRVLGRRMEKAGLPTPRQWISLGRIVNATDRLIRSEDTVGRVAHHVGYSDSFTMSNTFVTSLGIRPPAARKLGDIRQVVQYWLRRWIEKEAE